MPRPVAMIGVHDPGGPMDLLTHPTRYLFFTGKGGVGKTSVSAATAIALADAGRRVLLVSTDAASNLDEMLGTPLRNRAVAVVGVPRLWVLNIDPDVAAEQYRQRVLAQLPPEADAAHRAEVREQLSGACTTEIAAFDEFSTLLASDAPTYDHVVFDTAPTGHTLRLLSLPLAWSGFLKGQDRGASCLGPHSGLKMQQQRFDAALSALCDPGLTTVVLVARPESSALAEAARAAEELRALGLEHQGLVINGVFEARDPRDGVARAIEKLGRNAIANMPASLRTLPRTLIPLRGFDMVGIEALRALRVDGASTPAEPPLDTPVPAFEGLDRLVDALAADGRGLIMVMGKGGVGKTTIAAAVALGLVRRGHAVHLSTTDPAAHLAMTLDGARPAGLEVDRIDPRLETQRYVDKIMAARAPGLDAQEQALLLEDLRSPCTEEVAVFHAFSRTVASARHAFVVLDTAPTGHSLLLIDATGAYHRQMTQAFEGRPDTVHVITPLMRLQDPAYTHVVLVTLPETTPISQAAALQDDLRRAHIEPYAWVVNKSLLASTTRDPLLRARLEGERRQWARLTTGGLARRLFVVPWMEAAPVGMEGLGRVLGDAPASHA